MITRDQLNTIQGKTMYGRDDDKIGTIDTLYADRVNGEPTFATVNTGLFGTKTHFVPLAQAEMRGDDVVVPYDKDLVKDAPSIDPDAELTPAEEERLYAHYGLTAPVAETAEYETREPGYEVRETVTARDTAPAAGRSTDEAMTLSEEKLRAGTEKREVGKARLHKYVTTETERVDVPVSKERVKLEREPITEANRDEALSGPEISEAEHEVTLTEERPVVAKETVPVERVRLEKERDTDRETVSDEVRKERLEAEGVYPEGERTVAEERTRR